MSTTSPDVRTRALAAADRLFAEQGITATTLEQVQAVSHLTDTDLGTVFASKDLLVEAVLDDRYDNWMTGLERALAESSTPEDKLLEIFTYLERWFAEESFHRCAFVTSYGELGPSTGWVDIMVRRHRAVFDDLVTGLAAQAGLPQTLAASIALLAEGAQVSAAATGNIGAARDARSSAAVLIAMYRTEPHDIAF